MAVATCLTLRKWSFCLALSRAPSAKVLFERRSGRVRGARGVCGFHGAQGDRGVRGGYSVIGIGGARGVRGDGAQSVAWKSCAWSLAGCHRAGRDSVTRAASLSAMRNDYVGQSWASELGGRLLASGSPAWMAGPHIIRTRNQGGERAARRSEILRSIKVT